MLAPFGVGISAISVAELYDGIPGAHDPDQSERELTELVGQFDLLEVDVEIARLFGFERYRLRRRGEPIGDMDLLIAATAVRHDLTLLTNNRRHFDRIPDLAVESIWAWIPCPLRRR